MRKATDGDPIVMDKLRTLAAARFGDMIKAVVDLKRGVDDAATRAGITALVGRLVRR